MNHSLNIHQDLIDACKRHDERARRQLYEQYAPSIYQVCKRMVMDEDEAKDVLQECFISAFRHIANYRAEATFGAWLRRIAVNKAINHLNKKAKGLQNQAMEDVPDVPENVNEDEINWNVAQVKEGIASLPEGFRLVLNLYLFEGYDHQEIAQILNISPSTSKTQYMRGKRKLLSILSHEKELR